MLLLLIMIQLLLLLIMILLFSSYGLVDGPRSRWAARGRHVRTMPALVEAAMREDGPRLRRLEILQCACMQGSGRVR